MRSAWKQGRGQKAVGSLVFLLLLMLLWTTWRTVPASQTPLSPAGSSFCSP